MHRALGWKDLDPPTHRTLQELSRAVAVFPYTSRWDTFTVCSYTLDYPQLRGKFWIAMRDLPANRKFSFLFEGVFRVLWVPEGAGGFVENVVNQLKDQKEFILLISPEGDCEKRPWKSGYYHIARQLKASLAVFGFDFAQHCVKTPLVIHPDWDSEKNLTLVEDQRSRQISVEKFQEQIQALLQKAMGTIMPLHPLRSWVPITATGITMAIPGSAKLLLVVGLLAIILGILIYLRNK